MRNLTTSTAIGLAVALAAASGHAATEWTFNDIDADGNLELSKVEFEQVSRGAFAAWDENQDQQVSENELYGGIFSAWDTDNDGRLAAAEYNENFTIWFGDAVQPAFEDIDADNDGFLGEEDFASGMGEAGLADEFGVADEQGVDWAAFHASLFNVYDQDDDNLLDQDDYAELDDYEMAGGAVETTAAIDPDTIEANEVVSMADWEVGNLYADGLSVDYMIDEMEVYGVTGEEIGNIENVVFSNDGRVLSIVAEVGGFWDLFDTHVNVPWDQVEFSAGRVVIPVTEETVDDYSVFETDYLTVEAAADDTRVVDDDLATGPVAFRATDLIGDYARIRDGDAFANYGYVNDLVIQGGELQAVVVSPEGTGYGVNRYAYPYYGYGWNAGTPYYDMPYAREEVAEAEPLDYDQFAYE